MPKGDLPAIRGPANAAADQGGCRVSQREEEQGGDGYGLVEGKEGDEGCCDEPGRSGYGLSFGGLHKGRQPTDGMPVHGGQAQAGNLEEYGEPSESCGQVQPLSSDGNEDGDDGYGAATGGVEKATPYRWP